MLKLDSTSTDPGPLSRFNEEKRKKTTKKDTLHAVSSRNFWLYYPVPKYPRLDAPPKGRMKIASRVSKTLPVQPYDTCHKGVCGHSHTYNETTDPRPFKRPNVIPKVNLVSGLGYSTVWRLTRRGLEGYLQSKSSFS